MKTTALLLLGVASCWASATPTQNPLQPEKKHVLTHDLISFHKNLTQIESISGNEKAVGEWLASSLESQGYHVEKQDVEGKSPRFNVMAWPGKKSKDTRVLISSHIDTVPPFYPYEHKHKTISGRGSVDAKGSVATQIIAINKLLSAGKIDADDIAVLFVVDEEVGGTGMRKANDLGLMPQTVIFGEPTEGKLVSGHKGNLGAVITAKGKAAHSGYPWLGRSANEVLVKALAALMELPKDLPKSDKYGVTTINLGRMEGGVAANVVAQDASANIAVRIAEGSPAFMKEKITKAVNAAVSEFLEDDMEATDVVEVRFTSAGYGTVDIDHDVPGFESMTVNYGTDIPWLNQTVEGQKRYLYGPGSIQVAHSDHEMLTEDELWGAVEGYQKIILHALE